MKKSLRKLFFLIAVISLFAAVMCIESAAYSQGDYEYKVSDGEATITKYANYSTEYVEVTVPSTIGGYPVTAIGDGAFSGRSTVISVTLPDSVVDIEDHAFWHCRSIESIKIGKNVKSIGEQVFYYCDRLSFITVAKDNKYFSNDDNGVLFNKNKTELIYYPEGKVKESYTVPSTVKKVADSAFFENSIAKVTISEGVTHIGNAAFSGCENLKEISIPASVTHIGTEAFSRCARISSFKADKNNRYYSSDSYGVLFNKDKTELIQYAVGNSAKSYTIPDSVSVVGRESFSGCENLTAVILGKNVTHIGASAFSECINLENVAISDGVTCIEYSAFYKCKSIKSIAIPSSVESIGEYAFYLCRCLDKVYYAGDESQWDNISVSDYSNSALLNADLYFGHSHSLTTVKAVASSCKKTGLTQGKKCSVCGTVTVVQQTVAKTSHKYTTSTLKATVSKNGKITTKCSVCGNISKTVTVYYPKTISLSCSEYICDGKNKTPLLTVKGSNGKALTKNTDYKASMPAKTSAVGKYTVKVTFTGNYSGSKNLYFYVLPGAVSTVKASSQTSSSIKLSWSAVKGAAGYKIYRYNSSKKAYVSVGTTAKTSVTVSKLSGGTKYTFKIAAYGKGSDGKTYNSEKYTFIKTATCTVKPEISKASSTAGGKVTFTFSQVNGENGYQLYYSTSKNSGFKKYKNFSANTKNATATSFKSKKTYYFKIRTYKKTDSGYVYSPYSSLCSVKIK